jgi:nitrogen fixation protein NifX
MKVRIAVASTDGINVDEHFSWTEKFYIYDVDNEKINFIEHRENEIGGIMGHHDDERLLKCLNLVNDAKVVVAAKIGPKARNLFIEKGIRAYLTEDKVSDSLEKIIRSGKIKYLLERGN